MIYICNYLKPTYVNYFLFTFVNINNNRLHMDDLHERIETLMKKEGLSGSQLADKIGVQRSSISHILSGRNKPSLDFIQKVLSSYKHIQPDWLLFGKEPMYKQIKQQSIFDVLENQKLAEETDIAKEKKTIIDSEKKIIEQNINNDKDKDRLINEALSSDNKEVERIVIFYTDKTFKDYSPS